MPSVGTSMAPGSGVTQTFIHERSKSSIILPFLVAVLFFFLCFRFYWSIVDLQRYVSFRYIAQLDIHMLCAKLHQSCLTLCDLMDCSLPDSSIHGIPQAKILEWVAISSSRESSWPGDWIHVSYEFGVGRQVPYHYWHVGSLLYIIHASDSVQFNRSVVSDCLQPHGIQHARLLCPLPAPGVYSN